MGLFEKGQLRSSVAQRCVVHWHSEKSQLEFDDVNRRPSQRMSFQLLVCSSVPGVEVLFYRLRRRMNNGIDIERTGFQIAFCTETPQSAVKQVRRSQNKAKRSERRLRPCPFFVLLSLLRSRPTKFWRLRPSYYIVFTWILCNNQRFV